MTDRSKPQATCSVENCDHRASAKGLCTKHYFRQWRQGRRGVAPVSPAASTPEQTTAPGRVVPEPIPRYRAWHEQLKEMRPVRAIYFPTTDDPTGGVELHGHEGKCGFDEVVLMPGAGFATKNGTLFEGDLVHDDRYGMLLRVAYRQDFGWDGYAVGGSQEDMDFLLEEDGSHLEVLGNIYENPELLNPPSD